MKRGTQQFITHKAFVPLEGTELQDAAERLFDKYLSTFRGAPEATYLLRRQFFDRDYDKEYLQKNVFFVPRSDYLWGFSNTLQ